MTTFVLEVIANVETGEVRETKEVDGISEAVREARDCANGLKTEPCGLDTGGAGPDELFEIYPEVGYGTVAVREADE